MNTGEEKDRTTKRYDYRKELEETRRILKGLVEAAKPCAYLDSRDDRFDILHGKLALAVDAAEKFLGVFIVLLILRSVIGL